MTWLHRIRREREGKWRSQEWPLCPSSVRSYTAERKARERAGVGMAGCGLRCCQECGDSGLVCVLVRVTVAVVKHHDQSYLGRKGTI